MLRIDFVHDLVCPWCRIGLANLETALRQRPALEIELVFHPFQLDPEAPASGLPYREVLARKLGGAARLASVFERVTEAGRRAGVVFDLERIETMPNTLLAHSLVEGVGTESALAVVHALHEAHFVGGKDLGDATVLATVAARATGREVDELLALLADEGGRDRVIAAAGEWRRRGIHGVPFTVLGGVLGVEGAHPPELFVQALDEASRRAAEVAVSADDPSRRTF